MTWVVWALVILVVGAAASLLAARTPVVSLRIGLAGAGLAGALCLIGAWNAWGQDETMRWSIEWPLPMGFVQLALDGLSAWFLPVIGLISVATSVYTWNYFDAAGARRGVGFYGTLVCTLIGAMVLVICAADVVVFLLGWELMSLSAFFLVGFHDEDAEARRGAWTYLIATHLGTALGVLPVFAAFVARTGQTSMAGFSGAFGSSEAATCVAIFALGVVGFGTKAGFMPFHVWLPAAHPVAPSPVSALMSGVVIKTGVYGLLRLLTWLPELPVRCAMGLMIVSLVSGIMGILYALGQRQVKRMLAYSSIENIGIIGVAISVALLGRTLHQPALVAFGLGGGLLHVLNHALFKGLLFLSAGAVLHDSGTGDMERLGGLAKDTPINALAFLIGSVAICALPPLNGFVSEFAIYAGVLHGVVATHTRVATVLACCAAALALIGGLALIVFSKTFAVVFLGSRRDRKVEVHPTPPSMNAGMLILAAACAVVGVGAGVLLPMLREALKPFGAWTPPPVEGLDEALNLISRFSVPLWILIMIAVGLLMVRRRLVPGGVVGGASGLSEKPMAECNASDSALVLRSAHLGQAEGIRTWGCGYASPRPTMQYTGSSYAWKMIDSFQHLIRPKRQGPVIAGCFPSHDRLATSVADLAHDRIYRPIFGGLARLFERFWPLQHGRIQLYLVYIVATVLIVFLVEGWSQRRPAQPSDARPVHGSVLSWIEVPSSSSANVRSAPPR